MHVFSGGGQFNDEEVFEPSEDEDTQFEPDTDNWLARLIFWLVGSVASLTFLAIGLLKDPVALLALPVILVIGFGLWWICPHWVVHDSRKI
jgi:hypothetical protein